jgi:hypothetical protein
MHQGRLHGVSAGDTREGFGVNRMSDRNYAEEMVSVRAFMDEHRDGCKAETVIISGICVECSVCHKKLRYSEPY